MEEAKKETTPAPQEAYRAPEWFTINATRNADLPVPEDVIKVLEDALRAIDTGP